MRRLVVRDRPAKLSPEYVKVTHLTRGDWVKVTQEDDDLVEAEHWITARNDPL
jgi:hypothetical protein